MSMALGSILPIGPMNTSAPANLDIVNNVSSGDGAQKAGTSFAKFLNDALQKVNTLQTNADAASMQLASGQSQDLSSVMVALEKANLSLSLAVEVRNKALDAYHQIMSMQM